MSYAFVSAGTGAGGTTSLSLPFPATTVSGNLLIAVVCNKYPANAPTTPSGWTLQKQPFGGAGASGADTGSVFLSVYTKTADGTEGGTNLSVTITAGNAAIGNIFQYSPSAAQSTFQIVAASGTYDASAGASWSATANADLGILTGDLVLVFSGINTDLYGYSLEAITSTGVTFGTMTERADAVTTSGDDAAIVLAEFPVQDARSSAAPVYTMTASGTAASNPAGATIFLRIRELLYSATNFFGGGDPPARQAQPSSVEFAYAVPQIKLKDYGLRKGRAKTHESPYNK